MKIAEEIAVGQFLSSFPSDLGYDQICELIFQNSDDVTIWEPFENYPVEWVVENIDILRGIVQDALDNHTQVEDSTGDC